MQLIIDIPEELYKGYVSINLARGNGKGITSNLLNAIKKGTPLSENHGRIIDESKITLVYYKYETYNYKFGLRHTIDRTDAPTIIEASESEDKDDYNQV